jgi:hypothetical protein
MEQTGVQKRTVNGEKTELVPSWMTAGFDVADTAVDVSFRTMREMQGEVKRCVTAAIDCAETLLGSSLRVARAITEGVDAMSASALGGGQNAVQVAIEFVNRTTTGLLGSAERDE